MNTQFNKSWKQLKDSVPVVRSELEELAARAAESLEVKRRQAIDYLGADWVLHQNYQEKKKHSPYCRAI